MWKVHISYRLKSLPLLLTETIGSPLSQPCSASVIFSKLVRSIAPGPTGCEKEFSGLVQVIRSMDPNYNKKFVVRVVIPLMLAVLPYARGRGFDSRSRLLFIVWTNLCSPLSQIPFYKIEGLMTRVVRSAPQYPARNPLVNYTTTKYLPIAHRAIDILISRRVMS
jgi:hypothetical protein